MKDLKHLLYFENLLQEAQNELILQAQSEGKVCVAYVCENTPESLLNLPGAFSTRLRAPRTGSMEMATYYMTSFLCEYSRALLERAIEGGYNFADCLITPDGCTMMNRAVENMELLKALGKDKEKFFFEYMEIPMKADDNGLNLYTLQCKNHILKPLHEHYGIDVSDKAIRQAVAEHNRVCELIRAIGDFRKGDKPRITGYEFHVITLATYVAPKYLIIDKLEETLEELKTRGDSFHWDGNDKQGMEYFQANQPVRRQKDAVGHSVRAVYLYSGMADVAMRTQDESLKEACRTLFRSIAEKRMYVTGGIGSTYNGEAFTFDYDLPNDTAYAESCASIGLIFFMQRMLEMDGDAVYGDVMERALYNTVLSGMGLDGKAFFYVNPLEVFPEADLKDPNKHHVKIERQKWFACACCPPNIARLLADLGQYIYRKDENGVAVDLFIGSEVKVADGVTLTQNSQVPFGGKVSFKLSCPNGTKLTLRVRKPFWTDGVTCDAEMTEKNGYLVVEKVWNDGDTVSFDFAMPVRRVYASPYVRQDLGKVCLMRGPLVYCLEEADNGDNLHLVSLPEESEIAPAQGEGVLSGMTTLKAKGLRIVPEEGTLYRGAPCRSKEETQLTFIPYFAWANRGVGEMTVWVRE